MIIGPVEIGRVLAPVGLSRTQLGSRIVNRSGGNFVPPLCGFIEFSFVPQDAGRCDSRVVGLIRIGETCVELTRKLDQLAGFELTFSFLPFLVRQIESQHGDEPGVLRTIGAFLGEAAHRVVTHGRSLQEAWYNAGLRLLGPTHYGPGRYAGGTATELGLTALGPPLLREMERLGVLLDLTHLSDQAFWESLEHYNGLVLASHNNCRALVPHQRQFSDEQLKAIFAHDGVIGAAFDTWMLQPGWVVGQTTNEKVTIANVVDHIDHICQLAGNARHAAIGTDLDGGYGREQSPRDLDTIADLQKLPDLLAGRGYSAADIAAIMHGNWLRLLRQAWQK